MISKGQGLNWKWLHEAPKAVSSECNNVYMTRSVLEMQCQRAQSVDFHFSVNNALFAKKFLLKNFLKFYLTEYFTELFKYNDSYKVVYYYRKI